jgi:predicted nuclease with RNAse H fold
MIVGIDLAGSEKRNTGFCVMNLKLECKTKILYSNEEIIQEVEKVKPKVISIDAPLFLPLGRKSLKNRKGPHLRECDRKLLEMKIKFFPLTLGPMRKLTERGILLRKIFEKKGYKVVETYPGAAQDILKIPRKNSGIEKVRRSLKKLGIKGDVDKKNISADELDAIVCAYVGFLYLKKKFLALGNRKEGFMILPLP